MSTTETPPSGTPGGPAAVKTVTTTKWYYPWHWPGYVIRVVKEKRSGASRMMKWKSFCSSAFAFFRGMAILVMACILAYIVFVFRPVLHEIAKDITKEMQVRREGDFTSAGMTQRPSSAVVVQPLAPAKEDSPSRDELIRAVDDLRASLDSAVKNSSSDRKMIQELMSVVSGLQQGQKIVSPSAPQPNVESGEPYRAPPDLRQVMSKRMKDKGVKTSFSGSYQTYELGAGETSVPFCQDSVDSGRIWVSRKKGLTYEIQGIGALRNAPWMDDPVPQPIPEDANEIVVPKKGRIVFRLTDDGSGDKTPLTIKVWN